MDVHFHPAICEILTAPHPISTLTTKYLTNKGNTITKYKNKTATIGITEYAANALGDVVFVELPAVDTDVAAGETIGAVESVKSASDILCPVTGKIVEANTKLEESPKVINESPEEKGWFAKIELADPTELEGLMEKEVYLAKVEEADVES